MRIVDESKFNSPEETPDYSDAPEAAPPETNAEVVSTYDEAFEKKIKERVANVEVQAHEEPPKNSKKKLWLILGISFAVLLIAGALVFYFFFYDKQGSEPILSAEETSGTLEEETPVAEPVEEAPKIYSRLSGEEIASAEADSAPTYCVQIPNGVDGARDQVGLNSAKVVFEAIAEAGITRFAAIFQNPPAVVGPIRSLRMYYFNWDGPFDCTIVHAGGADDAIAALRASGNRDLDESTTYMFRSSAFYPSGQSVTRLWNNLFTTSGSLAEFNNSRGYLSSDIKGFPHFLPENARRDRIDRQIVERLKIDTPASGDTDALAPKVTYITMNFGSIPNFNPVFTYNSETNSYARSYQTGAAHNVFDCSDENTCTSVQLSPSVVIGMIVQERRAEDNYHENISAIGAGDAYIFQNGDVILGTWEKSSREAQIIFRDSSGNEVSLVPGQTWISAVPNYGSVHYE